MMQRHICTSRNYEYIKCLSSCNTDLVFCQFHKPQIIFGSTWVSSSGFHHLGHKKQALSAYPGCRVSRVSSTHVRRQMRAGATDEWSRRLWRGGIKDGGILHSIVKKSACDLMTISQELHTAMAELFLVVTVTQHLFRIDMLSDKSVKQKAKENEINKIITWKWSRMASEAAANAEINYVNCLN